MAIGQDSPGEETGLTPEDNTKLPTSIVLLLDGVEVFMYNRSVSYDNIVQALKKSETSEKESLFRYSSSLGDSLSSGTYPKRESLSSSGDNDISVASNPLSFPMNLLPIRIRIKRGAFVVGNPTTPSILVASFKNGNAILDVSKSPCILDKYRTSLDITMDKFQVSLKPNISYDPLRYTLETPAGQATKKKSTTSHHDYLLRIRKMVDRILPGKKASHLENPFAPTGWRGLRRYIDDFDDEKVVEISDIEEYAKYSLVLDTATTQLTYFYDVPGVFPPDSSDEAVNYTAPEFGVDLVFSMATIHYGSWADRQRGPIQTMLFPPLSRDSEPSKVSTKPGSPRGYAGFKLCIFTKDEIIFRLPTRELSKDKEILTTTGHRQQKITRPFGWIELKLRENSKISSFTSYLANPSGWPNTLSVYMDRPEARTSVNHDIMFSADEHILDCDIGFPLEWNGKCTWKFKNRTKSIRFFLLREHISLMTDVVADFSSGDPVPYEYYRKYVYLLNWEMLDYKLFFNVNDHNIINDALDFNNNKYLCFQGELLRVESVIPLNGPFSKSTKVDFKIFTTSLDLFLKVPTWHTVSAFMKGNKKMGSTDAFEIAGYYQYYNAVEVDHNNFAVINAIGDNITMLFYGYFIRYLFTLRENYFGDFKDFKTFEEYTNGQAFAASEDSNASTVSGEFEKVPDYWNILKTENDLNVHFTFLARKGLIILPCQIYDHAHHIGLLFDHLDVDIHLTHFYMDMQADFSTAFGYYFMPEQFPNKDLIWSIPQYEESSKLRKPDITFDGFSVHTHRMFGLAPDLLTYHCKWDFASDTIRIEGEPACLTGLKAMFSDFVLGFKDLENTLIYHIPIVYDMANFSFRCPEISMKLATGVQNTFFEVCLSDLLIGFNDIANQRYSDRITLSIPEIFMKVVNETQGILHQGSLKTSLTLTDICQKANMLEHRQNQQMYVRKNDAPTHRIPFNLFSQNKNNVYLDALGSLFASVSLPKGSFPLTKEYTSLHSEYESSIDLDSDDASLLSSNEMGEDEDEDISPTTNYRNEDFCPQTPHIPGFKHDTFVLEFGAIDAFITPEGTSSLGSLMTGFQNLDLQFLIDRLQVETVKHLKMLILPVSMVDNVRFVCPTINLKVVEKSLTTPDLVLCTSPTVPAISISVLEPSIAFSKITQRTREGFTLREVNSVTFALHVREIYISAHDPDFFGSPLTVHVSDIESWGTKDGTAGLVVSGSIKKLETFAESTRLVWTLRFLDLIESLLSVSISNMKSALKAADVWRKELIHMLTLAARDANMQHDPGVITKPATILKACDDHVRIYDSWKLITKLRSILNNLAIYEAERDRFNLRQWRNPPDALKEVISLFSSWRPWEGDMAQRSQYFHALFGEIDTAVDKNVRIMFSLRHAITRVNIVGNESDMIALHGVTSSIFHFEAPELNAQQPIEKMNAIINIEAFDGALKPTVFKIMKTVSTFLKKRKNTSNDVSRLRKAQRAPEVVKLMKSMSFLFHLRLVHLRFDLPHIFCDFYTYDNMSSFELHTTENFDKQMSVNSQSSEYSISFGENDHEFIGLSLRDLCLVYSGLLGRVDSQVLDVKLDELEFKILERDASLCQFLSNLVNEDLKELETIFPFSQNVSATPVAKTLNELPNFKLNLSIGQITALIELLYPARIHYSALKCSFAFGHENGNVFFKYYHKSVFMDFFLHESQILHYEHSRMLVLSRMNLDAKLKLLSGEVDLGYLKLTNGLLVGTLELIIKHEPALENRIKTLLELGDIVFPPRETKLLSVENTTTKSSYFDDLALKLNVNLEYFGFSTHKDRCRFSLEFEDISWVFANINRSNLGQTTPIWGELTIPSTRITIVDPLFSFALSTILDFSLAIKVLNDNTSKKDEPAQSLQIESQHFRICLSPQVLFKMVELADGINRVLKKHEMLKTEVTYSEAKPKQEDFNVCEVENPQIEDESLQKSGRFHFSSVHFLSYNFCVGWLFGSTHKDYPGFILGAERVFAVTKADLGKLTLMEGYLSVANGSTTTSFYSMLSEVDSLNRAYMPHLQINYFLSDEIGLWIKIIGEELDVRFMSNSISLIERAVQSGSQVQSYFEQRTRNMQKEKNFTPPFKGGSKDSIAKRKGKSPLNLKFKNVNITSNFAGSKVFIYRLQEDNLDNPPSLSVHSPAVLAAINYQHQKNLEKKHVVKAEILLSPSDNTLYSSCVPVLMDFVDASKLMFRSSKPIAEESPEVTEALNGQLNEKSSDMSRSIGNILKEVSFHFGFIIEKQRVSLSCEPTAKVAAIVESEGGSIHGCTGLDYNSIDVLIQLSGISASLQHIYSDERSGSFDIKSVLFSSSITFEPDLNVVSSVSISDVSAYVKMKQYQDVDLFKDIWYPKKYQFSQMSSDTPSEKSVQKSSHAKFREVSSTYAIPVALTFILSNISLEFDFGAALGIIILDLDRAWATSRKTSSWFYEFQFGCQTLVVGSDGRLGGYLKIEKLFLNSAIEWKFEELPYLDIPLVLFAAGFAKVHLKVAFDDHVFAFANLEGWRMDAFNRKNGINISKDHLYVMIKYDRVEVFLTSLAASDFSDIFSTVSRLIEEKEKSYKEILKDSNKEHLMQEKIDPSQLLEVAKKLETKIEVNTGMTTLQVYPQSLDDSRVLVVSLDTSQANFVQNEYSLGIKNEVELQLNNLNASLSNTAGVKPEQIKDFEVEQFVEYARKCKGGNILGFPKFMISMRTYQKYNTNVVDFLFQSSFSGAVDVRWNLGSVNLVREMYAAHKRALSSRTEYKRKEAVLPVKDAHEIKSKVFENQKDEELDPMTMVEKPEDPNEDIVNDLNETLDKVANHTKFQYVAMAPPVIEAPQLKELGNATPPLEWFGLHRNKFPDATHQFVIVTLQKLIHEIEQQYSKALGDD